ncbi:MAG TPA: hypothetical protein VFE51_31900 [Verrucomicrobiae bacterium]|nr:hypothetical protein [Verrucomicrobiae bacterium]
MSKRNEEVFISSVAKESGDTINVKRVATAGVIKSVDHSVLIGRKAAENSPKNSRIEPLNLENVQVLSNQRTNFKVHGEGCRSPRPSVLEARTRVALAFWTAVVLCRFFRLPATTDTSNRTRHGALLR